MRISFQLVFAMVALGAGSQAGLDVEDFFEDVVEAPTEAEAVQADHEAALLEPEGWVFGGRLTTSVGPQFFWKDLPPSAQRPTDTVELLLRMDTFLDARPSRDTRVFLKIRAEYPFDTTERVKIFELFTDFRLGEDLGFRFGKQVAGWGVSRFYQPTDIFSLERKDPTDLGRDLEGPLALKSTWTLADSLSLDLFLIAKESYLPEGRLPRPENLGYALRASYLLPFGGEATIGGFWQKDLAPRVTGSLVFGITGTNVQLFTDLLASWGSDRRFLEGTAPFHTTMERRREWFFSGTLGLMHLQSEWDMTLYAEYFFNGEGSADAGFLEDLLFVYGMEQALPQAHRTLTIDDLIGRSRHHASVSVSWADLFKVDRLGLSLVGQWNITEGTWFFQPSVSWGPVDELVISAGARLARGGDFTEFVTRQMGFRTQLYLTARLGVRSF